MPRHWAIRVLVTAAMVAGGGAVYLVNFYYDPLLGVLVPVSLILIFVPNMLITAWLASLVGVRPLWSLLWLVWPAGLVALGVIAWKVTLLPYRDTTPAPTEAWAFTEMRHPRLPDTPVYLRTRSRLP